MKKSKLFKLTLLLISVLFCYSCTGLREHIRQRQLETHGPPKKIRDHRNDNLAKDSSSSIKKDVASKSFYSKYSQKWGVELKGNEDEKLIKEIDSWLGTPYVYGGASKKGTDCSGMILSIYKTVYGFSLNRSAFDMQKDVAFVDLKKAKLGDVLFFKINGERVSHVGLYLGDNKFIHATTSKGVIISNLEEKYYATRYYKCGRLLKLN